MMALEKVEKRPSRRTNKHNRNDIVPSIAQRILSSVREPNFEVQVLQLYSEKSSEYSPSIKDRHCYVYLKTLKYELNKEKALKKKQNACDRQILCERRDNTNGITLLCQAGLYELLKRAMLAYYTEHRHQGLSSTIELTQDSSRNFVQSTIKVCHNPSGYNAYTVNLYHTTSSLQINGTGMKRFFETDWSMISDIIAEVNEVCKHTDPGTLNDNMKACLADALERMKEKKHKGNGKQKQILPDNSPQKQILPDDSPQKDDAVAQRANEGTWEQVNDMDELSVHSDHDNTDSGQQQWRDIPAGLRNERLTPPSEEDTMNILNDTTQARITTSQDGVQTEHSINTQTLQNDSGFHNPQERGIVSEIEMERTAHQLERIYTPPHRRNSVNNANCQTTPWKGNGQVCERCRTVKKEMEESVKQMQQKEKKMANIEKILKQREKEVEKNILQLETQKALIAGLEAKVRDLTSTNRLLQQIIDATPTHSQTAPQARTFEGTGRMDENNTEEIKRLREDIRMKDLESKITEQMHSMEIRMLNRLHQPPQPTIPTFYPMQQMMQPPTPFMPMMYPGPGFHAHNMWPHMGTSTGHLPAQGVHAQQQRGNEPQQRGNGPHSQRHNHHQTSRSTHRAEQWKQRESRDRETGAERSWTPESRKPDSNATAKCTEDTQYKGRQEVHMEDTSKNQSYGHLHPTHLNGAECLLQEMRLNTRPRTGASNSEKPESHHLPEQTRVKDNNWQGMLGELDLPNVGDPIQQKDEASGNIRE